MAIEAEAEAAATEAAGIVTNLVKTAEVQSARAFLADCWTLDKALRSQQLVARLEGDGCTCIQRPGYLAKEPKPCPLAGTSPLLTLARHLTFYPSQFCAELFNFTLRVLDVARRRGTGWTANISASFELAQNCFFFCEL